MKWVSVEKQLPREKERILVLAKEDEFIHIGNRDDNEYWLDDGYVLEIDETSHWMPLPEPPSCPRKECEDKESAHYFMCHSLEEQLRILKENTPKVPYMFNMIRKRGS